MGKLGKVSQELAGLLERQLDERGVVVWYDPDQCYTGLVKTLEFEKIQLISFENSFLALRREVDPFLECVEEGKLKEKASTPPRLILYIPRNRSETANALIEMESCGAVLEPGAHPWQKNTRLKVLAERVFHQIAPERASEIGRQVEQGALNLDDLDRLADQTGELGAIKLIFGTTSVSDIVLQFISSEKCDKLLQDKKALPQLASLLKDELGIDSDLSAIESEDIAKLRHALQRGLLLADFALSATGESEVSGICKGRSEAQMNQIRTIVQNWRNRRDLQLHYDTVARQIENETGISDTSIRGEQLQESYTFPFVEERLLCWAEQLVLNRQVDEALSLAERRKSSFWSVEVNQLAWAILETAAHLIQKKQKIEGELKKLPSDPNSFVDAYVGSASNDRQGWHVLDKLHRRLEAFWATFDPELELQDQVLSEVMTLARREYSKALDRCAEAFSRALAESGFQISSLLQQREIFQKFVQPAVERSKTAYLLVDSLRFEMATELAEGLSEDFEVKLQPAVGQLPGITDVGMAALLPGAEEGLELAAEGNKSLLIRVCGNPLRSRSDRIALIKARLSQSSPVDLKIAQLNKPVKKVRDQLEATRFAVVTSQEIDRQGESAEDDQATRRTMAEMVEVLQKAIRRLALHGFEKIIVAADHGHIYGEELDSGLKMDPPGGEQFELHRRAWIGRGGRSGAGYLRLKGSDVGLRTDLELAFPKASGCFKVSGGSNAYFHGGLSLQELIIPVLQLESKGAAPRDAAGQSELTLELKKGKITNRFFTISALLEARGLFPDKKKRVRISVTSKGSEVARPVSAEYGFKEESLEIELVMGQRNAITFSIKDPQVKSVDIEATDAATGIRLGRIAKIPVDLVGM